MEIQSRRAGSVQVIRNSLVYTDAVAFLRALELYYIESNQWMYISSHVLSQLTEACAREGHKCPLAKPSIIASITVINILPSVTYPFNVN